jgi:hypothetical protein
MAVFPKAENDVVALAQQIVDGLTNHAGDFPSVNHLEAVHLDDTLTNYKGLRTQQDNAKSQAQIATVTKQEGYQELIILMKNALKKAETDSVIDPEKLSEIGWGPKSDPTPINSPGTPTELEAAKEGEGTVVLRWTKPPFDTNKPVRNYIIERRQQLPDKTFGPWELAQTTYDAEMRLMDQPIEVRLEFRIKAANAAGESMPSNSAAVTLP